MSEDVHQPDEQPQQEPHISAFQNARELSAKAQRAQELAARERQSAADEAAYQEREAYSKELSAEKIELMRLKQGVIADSEKVFPAQEAPKRYTLRERFGNWLYHSKWWLGVASFCVLVTAFLVYDYVTRDNPDLHLLLLSNHPALYAQSEQICALLEENCDDVNEDGEVVASVVYVPTSKSTIEAGGNYSSTYQTQLLVQFQSAVSMLVLADDAANAYLEPDTMFVDLESLFPQYDFIRGYRIQLAKTSLAERIGLTETWNGGAYLALRVVTENMNSEKEMQAAYDDAYAVLERLLPLLATPAPATTEGET